MLQLGYKISPDEEGIFDGRDLARALISDAFKLLVPYADDCPACANNLFTVIANEEMELLHQQSEKENGLAALVMSTIDSTHEKQAAMKKHVIITEERTKKILEKASEYNDHEH